MLQKQKRGSMGMTPQERIAKACYVLNFLNRLIHIHFNHNTLNSVKERAQVMVKNLSTDHWEGPYSPITWG